MDTSAEKIKDSEAMRFPISSLKFLILKLLNKKPRYGYEIIKEIEKKTDRKPSQGLVYPILHEFEEKGFVKSTWDVEKKGRARNTITSQTKAKRSSEKQRKGSWKHSTHYSATDKFHRA